MSAPNNPNPPVDDGTINTHNPTTGDKTTSHLPPGTNPMADRTDVFDHNDQQSGQGNPAGPQGTQSHNTHNPLTGDKTGPNPPGTNPVTGRTNDGELGRNEQQYGQGRVTGPQGTQSHNTHNPLTGGDPDNTHNPMTGDKTGPDPPPGTNTVTGRTRDGEPGRDEQQYGSGSGTGERTRPNLSQGTNWATGGTNQGEFGRNEQRYGQGAQAVPRDAQSHNTYNPSIKDKTGPNSQGTNQAAGQTNDGEFGRNEQHYGQGGQTGPQDTQSHNTHNPLTGGSPDNTHNPMTGDKTGPNPPPGTNPVTGRTRDGELGRDNQQYGQGGGTGPQGTQSQNTHNPLTGGGPDNTHNPMTGNTTGPNPPPGTNPVTGRTGDGELGRNEQQNDPGSGIGSQGAQAHNTHNPLIGGGRTNTHNPFTGDKTGPNPPSGTNPVTGRTRDGELGQNEQQHLGGAGVGTTGLTGAGHAGQNTGYTDQNAGHTGDHSIHDTTHGAHTGTGTGVGTTHTTGSQQTSLGTGGAVKTLVGKAEAAAGKFLDDPQLQAKGVLRQQRAVEGKISNTGGMHRGMHPDPTGNPTRGHGVDQDKSAAGGGHVGAGAGQPGGQASI